MGTFNDNALEREATINVDRGLHLLRYVTGAVSGASPVAMVRPALGSAPFIEVISAPGIVSGFLSFPGECVVVRAEQPGQLLIKILRQSSGASMDASFQLESIASSARSDADVAGGIGTRSPAPVAAVRESVPTFRVLAHVSRRGDVEVGSGEWVAGPQAPAAVEGLEIRNLSEFGPRIEVQPLVATNPPRWLDWVPAGAFAGTRGRFLPLTGVRLRLAGNDASRFILSADALFLGSPIRSKRGREIELVSDSGADPLVGLRLDVEPAVAAAVTATAQDDAAFTPKQPEARVRVFRAARSN